MSSTFFLLRFNAILYFVSAIAAFSQVIVFASLGATRLSLFIAMFVCFSCNSLARAISLFFLSYDDTYLQGSSYADQDWVKYVYQIGLVFLTAGNMSLGNICVNMWALLQFKDGFYRRNSTVIRLVLAAFSFAVGLVELILFAATCIDNCYFRRYTFANLFSLFYVVVVGGFCLVAVALQLALNRKDCMSSLAQSNISLSLLYRMILGLLVLIIIGASSISTVLPQAKLDTLYSSLPQLPITSVTTLNAIIGLALSILFGSSEECLRLWRTWINKYLGIDLRTQSRYGTIRNGTNSVSQPSKYSSQQEK